MFRTSNYPSARVSNLTVTVGLFLLAMAQRANAQTSPPVLFSVSEPAAPSDTVLISGSRLKGIASISIQRLDDSPSKSSKSSAVVASVETGDNFAKFEVPSDFQDGVFKYTLNSPGGKVSGFLNRADVYWSQGNSGSDASPGGWIRLFGKNIFRSPAAVITLTGRDGRRFEIQPSGGDLWNATFPVPSSIPPGRYAISLWNGAGDITTWQGAGSIEIAVMHSFPLYQEVIPSELNGSNATDRSNDIEVALNSVAAHGGGTLLLRSGDYYLSSSLSVPPNVQLVGEDENSTRLIWLNKSGPLDVLIEGQRDFAIRSLSIISNFDLGIIRGGIPTSPTLSDGVNITLQNVRVRAFGLDSSQSPDDLRLHYSEMKKSDRNGVTAITLAGSNLVVEGCDIRGSMRPIFLLRPTKSRVAGNSFDEGRDGWYSISGADGLIFENNTISGKDPTSQGGGINTMFANRAFSQNVYFGRNVLRNIYGHNREALTTDGPGGFYIGTAVTASGGKELILSSSPTRLSSSPKGHSVDNPTGAGVFVVRGTGLGEYARINSVHGNYVVLDRALPVMLDNSSVVSIVPYQANYIISHNSFLHTGPAIQLYGTSLNFVVDSNDVVDSAGIIGHGLVYQGGAQPSWYNLFTGNVITGSSDGKSMLGLASYSSPSTTNVLNYGSVVRANHLAEATKIDIHGDFPGAVSSAVVEHNIIENSPIGVAAVGFRDASVRNNQFRNVGTNIKQ